MHALPSLLESKAIIDVPNLIIDKGKILLFSTLSLSKVASFP